MSTLKVHRPKQPWSVSPRTVLPASLVFRLLRLDPSYTLVLDGRAVGKIGNDQVCSFEVEPGGEP